MKAISIFFIAITILYGNAMAEEMLNVAPISEQNQKCVSNKECVLVQRHCGDCDCGTPVNIKFHRMYIEEKKNRCASYKGGICDLTCPTNQSVCTDGKCTTK